MPYQKPDIPIQLPLTVPVAPNRILFFPINTPLMMTTTMATMLIVGGIVVLAVNSPLEPFFNAYPAVLLAGAAILFILELIVVGVAFAWLTPRLEAAVCTGRLTVDEKQLRLSRGETETVIRWDTACQVRIQGIYRWRRHEHRHFEMWELTQGPSKVVLSRKVSRKAYKQLATRVRQWDIGQMVPVRPEQVFAAIAQRGRLEYI